MTATTLSLADFLLARLDEDEAAARAASPSPWSFGGVDSVSGGVLYDETRRIADVTYEQPEDHDGTVVRHLLSPEADANGAHIARHDPARVLADVAAKRKIVELHAAVEVTTGYDSRTVTRTTSAYCGTCHTDSTYDPTETWPCDTVRALASIYSDHPDFDPAWF